MNVEKIKGITVLRWMEPQALAKLAAVLEERQYSGDQAIFAQDALQLAGGLATDAPAYQRGIVFLLRTQFDNGSWLVRSRSWAFQPHFDAQFPHGKHQWISAGGTGWAAMALVLTLDARAPQPRVPSVQTLMASMAKAPGTARPAPTRVAKPGDNLSFDRDIRRISEKSCIGCHGGPKPQRRPRPHRAGEASRRRPEQRASRCARTLEAELAGALGSDRSRGPGNAANQPAHPVSRPD